MITNYPGVFIWNKLPIDFTTVTTNINLNMDCHQQIVTVINVSFAAKKLVMACISTYLPLKKSMLRTRDNQNYDIFFPNMFLGPTSSNSDWINLQKLLQVRKEFNQFTLSIFTTFFVLEFILNNSVIMIFGKEGYKF